MRVISPLIFNIFGRLKKQIQAGITDSNFFLIGHSNFSIPREMEGCFGMKILTFEKK